MPYPYLDMDVDAYIVVFDVNINDDNETLRWAVDICYKPEIPSSENAKGEMWETLRSETGEYQSPSIKMWGKIDSAINAIVLRTRYNPMMRGPYLITTERDAMTEKKFRDFAETEEGRKIILKKGQKIT